jgi:hypothetical protein
MDIGPTAEFREAWRRVYGTECSPVNVITAIRSGDPRWLEVERVNAEIIMQAKKELR